MRDNLETTKEEAPSSPKNGAPNATTSHMLVASQKNQEIASIICSTDACKETLLRAELSDLGNAQRLAALAGGNIRYRSGTKTFLTWSGTHWVEDKRAGMLLAMHGMKALREIAIASSKEGLSSFALRSQAHSRIKDACKLFALQPGIKIDTESLDSDDFLFNVQNGTIDLRSGELHPHCAGDFITKISKVTYDPEAKCPTFDRFIDQITMGRQDLASYLQRVAGYILTGSIKEQCLFFLYGGGSNGKSKFLDVLSELCGDYCRRTPASTLMNGMRSAGQASPDLVRLERTRMVRASELSNGSAFDESLIKDMTGGETMVARGLYNNDYEEFLPKFKLIFAGNHKPNIKGTDDGIWRRVNLIPFDFRATDEAKDPDLGVKLSAELSGVLNWAIEGCLNWQQEGLNAPQVVMEAVTGYRNESNPFEGWFEECCEVDDGAEERAKDLYGSYKEWAQAYHEKPKTNTLFGKFLTSKFEKVNKRGMVYLGVRLLTPEGAETP